MFVIGYVLLTVWATIEFISPLLSVLFAGMTVALAWFAFQRHWPF